MATTSARGTVDAQTRHGLDGATPTGLVGRVRHVWSLFGPGVLMAIAGIGSSHFLLAPTAGAAFGYALAWTIVVAHVVKYPAFAYASRYTVATGGNILNGFRSLPGPRNWAVLFFLVVVLVESGVLAGAVASVCAAVVVAAFPSINFGLAVIGVMALAMALLWLGAYTGLERLSITMLVAVVVLTVLATAFATPDLGALGTGIVGFAVPAGAALAVGGLLGFMPAPVELAVLKSLWHEARGLPDGTEARRARLKGALFDFRTGYVVSAVLGLMMISLGAALLNPRGLTPTGTAVFTTISEIYSRTLGEGVVPIYLLAAFLGMFATVYAVLDGFPRAFSAAFTAMGRKAPTSGTGRDVRYWLFIYATFVIGVIVAVFLPDPTLLVNLAATGTVVFAPIWSVLIIVLAHRLPEPFRPGPMVRTWAWIALAGMVGAAAYLVRMSFF